MTWWHGTKTWRTVTREIDITLGKKAVVGQAHRRYGFTTWCNILLTRWCANIEGGIG